MNLQTTVQVQTTKETLQWPNHKKTFLYVFFGLLLIVTFLLLLNVTEYVILSFDIFIIEYFLVLKQIRVQPERIPNQTKS